MHVDFPRAAACALPSALAVLLCAGCASAPPPDTASGLARLESSGNPLGCFPNAPVCRAYASFVDGRPVGYLQAGVEVPGGERRLFLVCDAQVPTPNITAQRARFQRNVYARLAPGRSYRVHGEWDGTRCTPTVVDVAADQAIPLENVVSY